MLRYICYQCYRLSEVKFRSSYLTSVTELTNPKSNCTFELTVYLVIFQPLFSSSIMTRIMSTALGSRQPFKLITVSRYPEKATLMVKKIAESLDDKYIFIHAANCECEYLVANSDSLSLWLVADVDEVKFRVRDIQPDMLVSCVFHEAMYLC